MLGLFIVPETPRLRKFTTLHP